MEFTKILRLKLSLDIKKAKIIKHKLSIYWHWVKIKEGGYRYDVRMYCKYTSSEGWTRTGIVPVLPGLCAPLLPPLSRPAPEDLRSADEGLGWGAPAPGRAPPWDWDVGDWTICRLCELNYSYSIKSIHIHDNSSSYTFPSLSSKIYTKPSHPSVSNSHFTIQTFNNLQWIPLCIINIGVKSKANILTWSSIMILRG